MSEQLSIEILIEKFKEAQTKGEELFMYNRSSEEYIIKDIGILMIYAKRATTPILTFDIGYVLSEWKIKQPKDEYEVLYENLTFMKEIGAYRVGFDKNPLHYIDKSFSGRKLMRNTRTGEITNYDEELLK